MILVLGATGFLGKNVCNKLKDIGVDFSVSSLSLGVDLRDEEQTNDLFYRVQPDIVINCASYVGGIQFSLSHAKELYCNNLQMGLNIYKAIDKFKVEKIINPITNCTYPGKETYFQVEKWWDGAMHDAAFVYGFVKKAIWVASKAYNLSGSSLISNHIILPNMYGPGDHLDEFRAHALGGMVLKFIRAQKNGENKVVVWGTGKPVREWLHIKDGAEALVRSLKLDLGIDPVNVGRGSGQTIKELAHMIRDEVDLDCDIIFDATKEDGAPKKTIDGTTGKLALNWEPEIDLRYGLKDTVAWYKSIA
jgi:GDP-L-fucose synthase